MNLSHGEGAQQSCPSPARHWQQSNSHEKLEGILISLWGKFNRVPLSSPPQTPGLALVRCPGSKTEELCFKLLPIPLTDVTCPRGEHADLCIGVKGQHGPGLKMPFGVSPAALQGTMLHSGTHGHLSQEVTETGTLIQPSALRSLSCLGTRVLLWAQGKTVQWAKAAEN